MEDIKFFLKFGKRKNIEGVTNGKVWLSTAECLRGIEDKLVKGQGDKLEASMHLSAVSAQITSEYSVACFNGNLNFDILIEPVKRVPMYCLFAVYGKDVDANGNIKLDSKTQGVIREHFPEADAVAVIQDPSCFVEDFSNTIHSDTDQEPIACKYELAKYFQMYGKDVTRPDGAKTKANDIRYLKYLTQDCTPQKTGRMSKYTVYESAAWRQLFCKDVFFEGEQEYRFILPSESVVNGKLYYFENTQTIEICGIDEFFEKMR